MQNTATIPMESLLAMLSGMSLNDRRWLAEQLTEQIEREATETAKSWNDFLAKGSLWEDDSNERLDAALACFHKDWGGDKDPADIAEELRQGAEMYVRWHMNISSFCREVFDAY